jgi:hypothetical protein
MRFKIEAADRRGFTFKDVIDKGFDIRGDVEGWNRGVGELILTIDSLKELLSFAGTQFPYGVTIIMNRKEPHTLRYENGQSVFER